MQNLDTVATFLRHQINISVRRLPRPPIGTGISIYPVRKLTFRRLLLGMLSALRGMPNRSTAGGGMEAGPIQRKPRQGDGLVSVIGAT
jgi:hypothetical protein